MTNYHKLDDSTQQKYIPRSSRGQKSEIKESEELVPSGGSRGDLFHASFLASGICQRPLIFLG